MQVSVHINRCQSSWYNANGKSGKQQIMDAKNSVWSVERTSSKLVHFVSIVPIRDFEKNIWIDNQVFLYLIINRIVNDIAGEGLEIRKFL